MGITGLLRVLKHGVEEPVHVSAYRGLVVAIDSMCWCVATRRGVSRLSGRCRHAPARLRPAVQSRGP